MQNLINNSRMPNFAENSQKLPNNTIQRPIFFQILQGLSLQDDIDIIPNKQINMLIIQCLAVTVEGIDINHQLKNILKFVIDMQL